MTEPTIPEHIRQFILDTIDSVTHLEGLLLLRSDRNKTWQPHEISQRLYIDESQSRMLLDRLCELGFVVITSRKKSYQYWPKSPDMEEMLSQLSNIYAQYLLPVTHLIHSKPKSRIQKFADAFRIRKE